MMNKKIAIITGASSGLGKAYLEELLKDTTIEEYWIIARRETYLRRIAKKDPRIIPYPCDLTDSAALSSFEQLLKEQNPDVRCFINNAGMGKIGLIRETSMSDAEKMIQLNVLAMTLCTMAVLPYMSEGSTLLQIASTAGFQPLPGFAIYAATKAYVLSFSKALAYECRKEKIHITTVCPYWIKDTEFISTAKQTGNTGFTYITNATTTAQVVKKSLADAKKKHWISTPDFYSSFDHIMSRVLPDRIVLPILDFFRTH